MSDLTPNEETTVKIETKELLTAEEAAAMLGCNKRALYRAAKRAEAAGHVCKRELFGKTLFVRAAMGAVKEHYYPRYSEAHQKMVKKWGAAGGRQKGINYAKKA